MAFWKRLLGDENTTALRRAEPIVAKVNALEDSIRGLSDVELRGKTAEFKKRIAEGISLDDLAPEARGLFADIDDALISAHIGDI